MIEFPAGDFIRANLDSPDTPDTPVDWAWGGTMSTARLGYLAC